MISNVQKNCNIAAFYKCVSSEDKGKSDILKYKGLALAKSMNKFANFWCYYDINGSISPFFLKKLVRLKKVFYVSDTGSTTHCNL